MSVVTQLPPARVFYNSGGFRCSRPVLTGPNAKRTFDTIPTVDFSQISVNTTARNRIAKQVASAARDVGFFYAINTPVSNEKIDRAFAVLKTFFEQPEEAKKKVDCHKSNAAKGYQPRQAVGPAGVLRESFSMGCDYTEPEQQNVHVAPEGSLTLNQWPDEELPEFRKALYEYYQEVYSFALDLVRIMSVGLGLPETGLDRFFRRPLTDITAQHYPVQSAAMEPKELLDPHADFGALTLLLQNDVSGLQVLNANGIWVAAPPVPYAFVVNTGNYIEALTNGRWAATVHRVFARIGKPRISLPFFLSPSPDVMLSPLEELFEVGEVATYPEHNISQRHVKGMLGSRATHPMLLKLKEQCPNEEDWRYEMLSRPWET